MFISVPGKSDLEQERSLLLMPMQPARRAQQALWHGGCAADEQLLQAIQYAPGDGSISQHPHVSIYPFHFCTLCP